MASVSMMIASLTGGATTTSQQHYRRTLVVAKAAACSDAPATANLDCKEEKGSNDGRRAAMFALAGAAVTAVVGSGVAFAENDEPKRGTPEAKKKYAPICVTMPTARICNKIA